MIKNEKQYKISKRKFKELVEHANRIKKQIDQNPLRNQLILASLNVSIKEIETNIHRYESLKKSKQNILKERAITDLPSLITEYKIIAGLTQKELSAKLGLKEQQLQRYEADNFKSVTFRNLLKFLESIGLEIRIKETRISKARKISKIKRKKED